MKIRTKIIVLFLSVSLSSVVLLGFFSFQFSKSQLFKLRGQQLKASAAAQKKNIQYLWTTWQERVRLVSRQAQLGQSYRNYLENRADEFRIELQDILGGTRDALKHVEAISLYDLSGNVIVTSGHSRFPASDYKVHRNHDNGDIVLEAIWIDKSAHELHVLLAGPILKDDTLLGYVRLILTASELLDIARNYEGLGDTGETIIARRNPDGDAQFITPLRYNPNDDLKFTVPADRLNIPMTQALLKKEAFFPNKDIVDYRGVPVFSATAYIPEMDWGVVVKMDQVDMLGSVRLLMRAIIGYVIAISVVAILVGLVFGRSIARPIVDLTNVAKRISDGDLSQTATITTTDEVGYLAKIFNNMLTSLVQQTVEIEDREEKIRAIVDNTIDGIITIDCKGTVESFNKACEGIFGYNSDEVIGEIVKMLMPEPYHSEHDDYLQNYHDTGDKKVIGVGREVMGRRKNGSTFPIDLSVSEINVQGNKLFSGIVRDISERKQNQDAILDYMKKLEQSNRELDDFAYIASHDLKEPLRGLSNNAMFLKEDFEEALKGDGETRLNRMIYLCQRMEQLVDDLLYFSRLGRQQLAVQETNLNDVITDIESLMETTLTEQNARIVIPKPLPTIICDLPRITEVLRNLIVNAVKYNDKEEKTIEIGVSDRATPEGPSPTQQVFYVRDNGIGIAENFHEDVFRIFKRLNNEDDSVRGTGVGLTFVKKIIERHNGRIWIESAIGKSTTFNFTIN